MTAALGSLRVIELDGMGPAPWCAMLLARLGADITRIGRPGVQPAAPGEATRGGRPVIGLDLKTDDGRQQLLDRIRDADVLIEGFRPGVMERLGLGPQQCLAVNPALVYGRMTGWGQDGPLAHTAGHDINYIALAGLLHAIGPADGPPVPPLNLLGDYGGGGAFLAIGLLAAVIQARTSGQGAVVDAAMIDGAANLMMLQHERLHQGRWNDARGSNSLDGAAPWYTVYETKDGRHVAVGAIEPEFYAAMLRGLNMDPASLPPREDRAAWPRLRQALARAFASRTRDEWAQVYEGTDACVTPVLSMREAPQHPHHRARGTFDDTGGPPLPATAPRIVPASVLRPKPPAPQTP